MASHQSCCTSSVSCSRFLKEPGASAKPPNWIQAARFRLLTIQFVAANRAVHQSAVSSASANLWGFRPLTKPLVVEILPIRVNGLFVS